MIHLVSIFVYPVKSCRGIALDASAFGPDGLLHDREFLVVDDGGRFLTQRAVPRLALIETGLAADSLILRARGLKELRVPWQLPKNGSAEKTVTIWRDTVQAADAGEGAASWFTRALGQPARLVRRGPAYARFLPEARIPTHVRAAVERVPVSFADAFPALVISEESLADLNHRLDDPLPMDRFRPNLVLRGCAAPYAEDTWPAFRVGGDAVMHAGEPARVVRSRPSTSNPPSARARNRCALWRFTGATPRGAWSLGRTSSRKAPDRCGSVTPSRSLPPPESVLSEPRKGTDFPPVAAAAIFLEPSPERLSGSPLSFMGCQHVLAVAVVSCKHIMAVGANRLFPAQTFPFAQLSLARRPPVSGLCAIVFAVKLFCLMRFILTIFGGLYHFSSRVGRIS